MAAETIDVVMSLTTNKLMLYDMTNFRRPLGTQIARNSRVKRVMTILTMIKSQIKLRSKIRRPTSMEIKWTLCTCDHPHRTRLGRPLQPLMMKTVASSAYTTQSSVVTVFSCK